MADDLFVHQYVLHVLVFRLVHVSQVIPSHNEGTLPQPVHVSLRFQLAHYLLHLGVVVHADGYTQRVDAVVEVAVDREGDVQVSLELFVVRRLAVARQQLVHAAPLVVFCQVGRQQTDGVHLHQHVDGLLLGIVPRVIVCDLLDDNHQVRQIFASVYPVCVLFRHLCCQVPDLLVAPLHHRLDIALLDLPQ